MVPPIQPPWHHQISRLALFISVPQLVVSPISVGISHFLHPQNVFFEITEILDFLAISFPLTLSVAILFVLLEKGKFNLGALVLTVAGAALLSNLLHGIIEKIPAVDIERTLNESVDHNSGGNAAALKWVGKIFGVYWKTFGPILFIQSCCIGIYAGYKYIKIEDSKKAKKQ